MVADSELILELMQPFEARLYLRMLPEHRQTYRNLRVRMDEYVLDFLAMNIRYFTSHGKRHSLGVIRQLSNLLPDNVLETMTSVEVLILLCGAWLHDIGLLVNRDEKGRELNDAQIRDRHHELSTWKIREISPWIGLDDRNMIQLLAEICVCHRRSVEILTRLPQPERFIQEQRVRTHLLAALLRAADALDTDYHRAPLLLEQIGTLSDDARLHWRELKMHLPTYHQLETTK